MEECFTCKCGHQSWVIFGLKKIRCGYCYEIFEFEGVISAPEFNKRYGRESKEEK